MNNDRNRVWSQVESVAVVSSTGRIAMINPLQSNARPVILEGSAHILWEMLAVSASASDLADQIEHRSGVPADEVLGGVMSFLVAMENEGLVECREQATGCS